MSLSLVLALQAAVAAAPAPAPRRWAIPAPAAGAPLDFDLARYQAAGGRCFGAGAGEVLVCGRRRGTGDFPLAYWAQVFAPRPIRAEKDLGGNVQGRIHSEAVPMDRGQVSNRVMIGIISRF